MDQIIYTSKRSEIIRFGDVMGGSMGGMEPLPISSIIPNGTVFPRANGLNFSMGGMGGMDNINAAETARENHAPRCSGEDG
ncbi:hypothetical protein GCM10009017_19320 [Halarchaeum rubridurum]|uniref:Uncharacterized protein n=1 Tax=Halarchaeum rubridurum TaxID=489911 RepID=A0A830G0J2_9EURY|nr:hypothetical protein GCM10009017_19320 [Halarchaeum rubridurum]